MRETTFFSFAVGQRGSAIVRISWAWLDGSSVAAFRQAVNVSGDVVAFMADEIIVT